MGDFFKFEDEGRDFPFYNEIPKLSTAEWIILALGPILMGVITLSGGKSIPGYDLLPNGTMQIVYFLITFIPIAYVCHGKLGLIYQKPRLKDFKIIILCFILYLVYGGLIKVLFSFWGVPTVENPVTGGITIFDMGFALIQLMGEELFKATVLLIAMGLIYYLTKNRKSALVFGAFASMMLFGLIHLTSYGNNLYQCIFIIGVGSIFHLFPYIKTKNVFNSYIVHIMLDMSTMLLVLIGSH